MGRKVMRTLLVGLITGLLLVVLLLPGLDAMGRILLMPPVYKPAARILVGAFWLASMGAAWSYRPAAPPVAAGEGGDTAPPDSPAHVGGP